MTTYNFAGTVLKPASATTPRKLKKGILRTGHWTETPTPLGKVKRPLDIVRGGKSNARAGVLSLEEIVDNFVNRRCVQRVLVPFADRKDDDHVRDGNLARVNTGFVDRVWIESEGGIDHLMAEITMTDAAARRKIIEGSVDDVSSGIPFDSQHGAYLDHVALTPYPFIDGQRPWVEASDRRTVAERADNMREALYGNGDATLAARVANMKASLGKADEPDKREEAWQRAVDLCGSEASARQRGYRAPGERS